MCKLFLKSLEDSHEISCPVCRTARPASPMDCAHRTLCPYPARRRAARPEHHPRAGKLERRRLPSAAAQTGLFPPALEVLRERDALHLVKKVQQAYHTPAVTECSPRLFLTRSERLQSGGGLPAALEDGDILITPCAHVTGFRNGHAGLVVDAKREKRSNPSWWGMILPSKKSNVGETSLLLRSIACGMPMPKPARQSPKPPRGRLTGIPYNLTVGYIPQKRMSGTVSGTQCAHLVWEAFAAFGYDLDANGGRIVTPADLAHSPLLELKQVYGLPYAWSES